MHVKSSTPEQRESVWHQTRIWWPVECVPLTLEIAHPRRLTALEWAVLRVVDEFRDQPPSLAEVAHQLGIEDPSFLADAVSEAVRLRALVARSEDIDPRSADLPDLAFTSMGLELYRRGQIEAEPAEHGETFYFDALTDESLQDLQGMLEVVEEPFPGGVPPEPREGVGLERTREIVRQRYPDLLRGDGEVRTVAIQSGRWPHIGWRPVDVSLRITDGRVEPDAPSISPEAQRFLADSDLVAASVLPTRVVSSTWSASPTARLSSGHTYQQWTALTQATVAVRAVTAEALRLLRQVKREVVVHAIWLEDHEVRARLEAVVREGRVVVVVGAGPSRCLDFVESPKPGISMMLDAETPVFGALVVDGRIGLLIDDVLLQAGSCQATVELVGSLGSSGASHCRDVVLAGMRGFPSVSIADEPPPIQLEVEDPVQRATEALNDPELLILLARLALPTNRAVWDRAVDRARELAPGLERIELLRRLAVVATGLVADSPGQPYLNAAREEWSAAARLFADSTMDLGLLNTMVELAPEGVDPTTVIDSVVRAWCVMADRDPAGSGGALVAIRELVDARWGPGTASSSRRWMRARDDLLGPARWTPDYLPTLAELAGELLLERDLAAWAILELEALQTPRTVLDIENWLSIAEPLRQLSPVGFEEHATLLWADLVAAHPGDCDTLVRLARGVLPAGVVAGIVLETHPTLRQLVQVRRLLDASGFHTDPSSWRLRYQLALPDPGGLTTTASMATVVADLLELGPDDPDVAATGASWAASVVDQLPIPTVPEGVVWYLGEIAPLRGLLQGVLDRASSIIRPHVRQLDAARTRGGELWADCVRSWESLGLATTQLEALISRPRHKAPNDRTRSFGGKRKDKKRRKKR